MACCTCGHEREIHFDLKHTGSTACSADGCDCIAYEWDGENEFGSDDEEK